MEELEKLRKAYVNHMVIGLIISIVVVVILFVLYNAIQFLFFAFIICFMIVLLTGGSKKKKYSTAYKKEIVTTTMQELFTDIVFDYDKGLPSSVIKETDMMRLGNRYSSNDWYSGKYKDVSFTSSDVSIEEVTTDSEGHTHTTVYFRGQWYIFNFNKNFKGKFQVCEKDFHYSKHGGLFDKSIEKVEVEDIDFNKQFRIYSTDAHSVFYVLTPHIIESIKKINEAIPGRLLLIFKDNSLHVGIYNGSDNFEPSIFHKIDVEKSKEKVRKEIEPITKFVEELRLDNNIFSSSTVKIGETQGES